MKTTPWSPKPEMTDVEFGLEDEVIFDSATIKGSKRMPLVSALLTGTAHAAFDLPFQILNGQQELLVVFDQGGPARGYPPILRTMLTVAEHLDERAKVAVQKAVEHLKAEAAELYAKGVEDGIAAERERHVREAGSDAPGDELPSPPAEVTLEIPVAEQPAVARLEGASAA